MGSGNSLLDMYDDYAEEGQREYFKNECRKKIEEFIKKCGYTYSVEDILENYQNYYLKGYYISFTTEICITNLEEEIKYLLDMN